MLVHQDTMGQRVHSLIVLHVDIVGAERLLGLCVIRLFGQNLLQHIVGLLQFAIAHQGIGIEGAIVHIIRMLLGQ